MLDNFFTLENSKKGKLCCSQMGAGLIYHEHEVACASFGLIWVCFVSTTDEKPTTLYACLTVIKSLGTEACRQFCLEYTKSPRDVHERLTEDAGGYDQ